MKEFNKEVQVSLYNFHLPWGGFSGSSVYRNLNIFLKSTFLHENYHFYIKDLIFWCSSSQHLYFPSEWLNFYS